MTNQKVSGFFQHPKDSNLLWQYLQSLDSETAIRLSQPSQEAAQIIESNIVQMLGGLPPEDFAVMITTSRENLGRLLASAMLSGYFIHNVEQRLELEKNMVYGNYND
jgi:hypothetical protein